MNVKRGKDTERGSDREHIETVRERGRERQESTRKLRVDVCFGNINRTTR
jgi:hypothetical protein